MKKFCCIYCSIVFLLSSYIGEAQTNEYDYWETYAQYVPSVASVALGWFGVESKDKCFERFAKVGVSFASEGGLVGSVKHFVDEERPDGSSNNSFPSGHTAMAFTGAELVRYEYGNMWGLGAYTLAIAVGLSRVYRKRHYIWDVAGGAVFGFAAARIGIFCTNKFQDFYTKRKSGKVSFSPFYLQDSFGFNLLISGL